MQCKSGWISVLYSSYGTIQSSSKYVLCLEPATLLNIAFRIDKNFATFSKELPSNTMIYRIIIAEYAWWVDAIFFITIPGLLCKPQSLKFSMAQLNIYRSLLRNLCYFLLRSSTLGTHAYRISGWYWLWNTSPKSWLKSVVGRSSCNKENIHLKNWIRNNILI